MSFWVESLGFLAGAIGMVQGIPQAVRIYRLDSGYGVSLSSWWLMLVKMAAWAGYGIIIASPSVIVSNGIGALTSALVVVALLRQGYLRDWGQWSWLIVVPVVVAIMMIVQLMPAAATNIVLFLLTLARVPQLVVSWLNMKRGIPTAVSISALVLGVLSMSCWGLYGLVIDDQPLIWTTVLALVLTLATSSFEIRTNVNASRK